MCVFACVCVRESQPDNPSGQSISPHTNTCVLQCVAVCCSVLQYVAVCCSSCMLLQCVACACCCSMLQCVAVCCSVLQFAHVVHTALAAVYLAFNISLLSRDSRHMLKTQHHTATHCNTLQHTATHSDTLQHTTTHVAVTRVTC